MIKKLMKILTLKKILKNKFKMGYIELPLYRYVFTKNNITKNENFNNFKFKNHS